MKKRIFIRVFAAVILASLLALVSVYICALLTVPDFYELARGYAAEIILFLLFFLIFDNLLAFLVAWLSATAIVKPITRIDPRSINDAVVYEELRPLVSRLSIQNSRVSKQKNQLAMRENEFNSITP